MLRTAIAVSTTVLLFGLAAHAQTPSVSIDDAEVTEGTGSETRLATFAVTLEGGAGAGWVESFDASVAQPLTAYDPRWVSILGNLYVSPTKGAATPNPNTSPGDDYDFRGSDTPTGSVAITLDFYWDGNGAVGALGAVESGYPHRFYEAAFWQHRVDILYIYGPSGGDWITIAQSPYSSSLGAGFYRLVFQMVRSGGSWAMTATVQDPANGYAEIVHASVSDAQIGEGTQGIGIYSDGTRGSYITEMRVDPL
jgi:hypothetical protein